MNSDPQKSNPTSTSQPKSHPCPMIENKLGILISNFLIKNGILIN